MSQIIYEGKLSAVEILRMEPFVSENEKVVGCWKLWLADGTEAVLPEAELLKNNIRLAIDVVAEVVESEPELALEASSSSEVSVIEGQGHVTPEGEVVTDSVKVDGEEIVEGNGHLEAAFAAVDQETAVV